MAELKQANTPIYIAQGTADDAIDPAGVDVMVSELLAAGKNVTYDRVEAADHSFRTGEEDGWPPSSNASSPGS
jgi:dienelactone hydrolase